MRKLLVALIAAAVAVTGVSGCRSTSSGCACGK
jgi:hypothetical protein